MIDAKIDMDCSINDFFQFFVFFYTIYSNYSIKLVYSQYNIIYTILYII